MKPEQITSLSSLFISIILIIFVSSFSFYCANSKYCQKNCLQMERLYILEAKYIHDILCGYGGGRETKVKNGEGGEKSILGD